MFSSLAVGFAFLAALSQAKHHTPQQAELIRRSRPDIVPKAFLDPTCTRISKSISNASAIYPPGTTGYNNGIEHWASSATQYSACVVEPGNAQDVAVVMKILSNSTIGFAVRGGGHSPAGFSSTKGVQISMSRFRDVTYQKSTESVDIGTGLLWDDVYAKIIPQGINVVGGRVSGVGVAGFALGGGYSWLTNEYGLTCDNAVGFEVVTPAGQILQVSPTSNQDLMYGLKGGFNNFGIVTRISLKAYPQGQIWGGSLVYSQDKWDQVTALVANFSATNTDVKGNILPTYDVFAGVGALLVLTFYNGPTPPPGLFDPFLAVPTLQKDLKTRSFSDLVGLFPSNITNGLRGAFASVSLEKLTPEILKVIVSEAKFWGVAQLAAAGVLVSYDVEPFVNNTGKYPANSETAWPHNKVLSPLNLYFAWPLGLSDNTFYAAIQKSVKTIKNAAIAQGQQISDLYTYPNYAFQTDSIQSVYGPNLPSLKALAAKYDPTKVMTRSPGFMFQN